jgi:hypothetical protein
MALYADRDLERVRQSLARLLERMMVAVHQDEVPSING